MKKIILPIISLLILSACSNANKELDTSKQLVLTAPAVANADTAQIAGEAETPAEAPVPVINNYYYAAPKAVATSTPKRKTTQPKAPVVVQEEVPVVVPEVTPVGPVVTETGNMETGTENAAIPAEAEKKKGISDAAKGAIIGGVGGAAAGAVIGKNGKGAVIGAVIGAAGGYILGRKADKKSGRIDFGQ